VKEETDSINKPEERHVTRVERARLETLQAFGGGGLEDIVSRSKQHSIDKSTEISQDKENLSNDAECLVSGSNSY